MDASHSLLILLLLFCFLLAAFASAAETALTGISRVRLRQLVEEGNDAAKRVEALRAHPNRYLSTILFCNTLAVVGASIITAGLVSAAVPRGFGDVITTLGLSLVILVFAEITPKTMALQHAERVALRVSGPVQLLSRLLSPVLAFLSFWTNVVAPRAKVRGPFVTEEELRMLVSVGEEEGVFAEEETEMIHGIFELGETVVREVMVPRLDVVAVPDSVTLPELIRLVRRSGHSRIPVYEGTLDKVIGVVYAKDLLRFAEGKPRELDVRALMRKPLFLPEAKKIDSLLRQMLQSKVHIAIAFDEYGATSGMVTLENLLEEIVGEIRDEYDQSEQPEIRRINDGVAEMDARVPYSDVREFLGMPEPDGEEDYDSLGGYIYAQLGEAPSSGAVCQLGHSTLTVLSVDGHRIRSVRVETPRAEGRPPADV